MHLHSIESDRYASQRQQQTITGYVGASLRKSAHMKQFHHCEVSSSTFPLQLSIVNIKGVATAPTSEITQMMQFSYVIFIP